MRIKWTNQAAKALEQIFTCSQDFYGRTVLKTLNERIKQAETLLLDNPYLGAMEPLAAEMEMEYRRFVLNDPFKLIYFILDDCVYIADIWDTRKSNENLTRHLV